MHNTNDDGSQRCGFLGHLSHTPLPLIAETASYIVYVYSVLHCAIAITGKGVHAIKLG